MALTELQKDYARGVLDSYNGRKIPAFILTDGELFTSRGKYRLSDDIRGMRFELQQPLSLRGFHNSINNWTDARTGEWFPQYVALFNDLAETERIALWADRKAKQDKAAAEETERREKYKQEAREHAEMVTTLEKLRKQTKFTRVSFTPTSEAKTAMFPINGYAHAGLVISAQDASPKESNRWTVSHLISGLAIIKVPRRSDAEFITLRLAPMIDWTQPPGILALETGPFSAVRQLVEAMRENGAFAKVEKK